MPQGAEGGGRAWHAHGGSPLCPRCHLDCRHLLGGPLLIWSLIISSLRLPRRHPSSLTSVSDSLAHSATSFAFGGPQELLCRTRYGCHGPVLLSQEHQAAISSWPLSASAQGSSLRMRRPLLRIPMPHLTMPPWSQSTVPSTSEFPASVISWLSLWLCSSGLGNAFNSRSGKYPCSFIHDNISFFSPKTLFYLNF